MDLRGLFLNDRVAAALVTALVGGGVVAAGWFWTHALSRRRDRQLREERVTDLQRALLAEIRAHVAALEGQTLDDAGRIAGPGWYRKPEGVEKVIIGEGSGDFAADKARVIEGAFDKIIGEMDSLIAQAESSSSSGGSQQAAPAAEAEEDDGSLTDVLPGFPEKIEGEIVFL